VLEDVELDLQTAGRIVALAGRSLRADSVTRLTGGASSAVFEVGTGDGTSVVVKLYSDLLHWKLQKELYVDRLLRERAVDVPAPEVLAADDSRAVVGQNLLVLTKVDGQMMQTLLDRLEERELVQLNRQIGAILHRLAEVRLDAFGYIGTEGLADPRHETNGDYMRFQFETRLRELVELGGDVELRRSIERHVAERDELFAWPDAASFVHNDCHYGNVLVVHDGREWRVSGLLDYENAVAGDPLLDPAKTHCYATRRSERTLAALVEGDDGLRPEWRETIDLYVLYHLLELWTWFATVGPADPLPALAGDMRRLVS